jgi:hypothetical protein
MKQKQCNCVPNETKSTMTGSDMGGIAPQLKPIPNAISNMEVEVTHLSDVCHELEARLSIVLSKANVREVDPRETKSENGFELVRTLECLSYRISNISSNLKGIMDRLGI